MPSVVELTVTLEAVSGGEVAVDQGGDVLAVVAFGGDAGRAFAPGKPSSGTGWPSESVGLPVVVIGVGGRRGA
jgi:hypothetical protein